MEPVFENVTEVWNVSVITEIVTEILGNPTERNTLSSVFVNFTSSHPSFALGRNYTSVPSAVTLSYGMTSVTATRRGPREPPSCRPGFPSVRQVCRDPLFYPHVATFFMVAFAFVIIAAIVMNSLVLLVMARTRLARRSSHNVYAASLAFSDLMVVLVECPLVYIQFLLPGDVSEKIFNPQTQWVCIMAFFFNCFFGTTSIMTQLALNIDRYCMIIHPLTTMAIANPTKTRAGFILVLVWSVSMIPQFGNIVLFKEVKTESYIMHDNSNLTVHFCLSQKPSDNPNTPHVYTATVFCIFYVSTLVTTLGLYVKIVISLQRTKPRSSADDDGVYSIYMRRDSVRVNRQKYHRAASRNILRIMGCSVLSYCFCYSIYFYINLYYIYFGLLLNYGFSLLVIANMMGALNALVNPILFACYSEEFKKLLCGMCGMYRGKTTGIHHRTKSYINGHSNGGNSRTSQHTRHASSHQLSSSSSAGSLATSHGNGTALAREEYELHSHSVSTVVTEAETET